MKEVFDLIKERLEEQKQRAYRLANNPGVDKNTICGWIGATDQALTIVGQIELECKMKGEYHERSNQNNNRTNHID